MQFYKKSLLFLFFLISPFYGSCSQPQVPFTGYIECVQDSVTSEIDKWESLDSLQKGKYSRQQYKEIVQALALKKEKIRVVSYNVLFNRYDHQLAKENHWPQRLPRILALIEEMQPDILGVQELYPSQAEDLMPLLKEKYHSFSKTTHEGELNAIFYRKDRFGLQEGIVLAMTATPQVPSMHDLTIATLKDVQTGKNVAIFNVHLAFGNIEKRDFQARFIASQVEAYADHVPVILMGDMNTFPHRLDLETLPFYDGDYIQRLLTGGPLKDAREVSLLGHLGPLATFNNFTSKGIPGVFLDHVYVSKNIKVLLHAVQSAKVSGHFPSDHMPIIVDCLIE